MKVILTEKVKSLGNVGEIVNVSAGFGRNYLIPNRFAVLADDSNKAELAHHQKSLAKKVDAEKNAALDLKKKIDGLTFEMIKKVGGSGKLFGTVTSADLVKELEGKGIAVEKRVISVENPIKSLGTHSVKVKLFSGVEAAFTVKVTMDPAQAEEIKKKQELAALKKEAQANAADSETDKVEEKVELTEEQMLKAEADRLLRS